MSCLGLEGETESGFVLSKLVWGFLFASCDVVVITSYDLDNSK